jgi:hypothetical protein
MNDENLIPNSERTPSELREQTRRGGIASGKARRRKADLRKAMQEAMNTTFTDKKGRSKTGEEMVIAGIIANLSDPHARNWGRALDALLLLTGQNMTKEQIAKIKAETELTKAKTKAIQQDGGSLADIEDLTPLANLLRGETNDENGND